jgi:hypothetical protein
MSTKGLCDGATGKLGLIVDLFYIGPEDTCD